MLIFADVADVGKVLKDTALYVLALNGIKKFTDGVVVESIVSDAMMLILFWLIDFHQGSGLTNILLLASRGCVLVSNAFAILVRKLGREVR